MRATPENIEWAGKLLSDTFGKRRGFPANATQLKLHAMAFLCIVHNKRPSEIIGQVHHIIGDPNDVEWLMLEAMNTLGDDYPMPIELRKIYQTYLPPADGEMYYGGD